MADDLDRLFGALANGHRREMVHLLGLQPHSISRLAAARGLSLPAMNKHVRVLEDAGLVTRRKLGRTTFLALDRCGHPRAPGMARAATTPTGGPRRRRSRTTSDSSPATRRTGREN